MAASRPRKAAGAKASGRRPRGPRAAGRGAPGKPATKAAKPQAKGKASAPVRAPARKRAAAKPPPKAAAPRAKAKAGSRDPGPGSAPMAEAPPPTPTAPRAVPAGSLSSGQEPEGWIPLPDPAPAPVRPATAWQARPFDPATGAWLPVEPAGPGAPWAAGQPSASAAGGGAIPEPAPEAAKKTAGSMVWNVVLGIDLAFLALNFLAQLAVGAVLLFAPDSATAEELQDSFGVGSPRALAFQQALTFVLMGAIPFLWVLGTRRVTWEGTKRYLHLHEPGKGILRGVLLTPLLLLAVMALIVVYTLATQGADGLSLTESEEGQNPAVDAILAQLTWPVAILIAITAGVGEEILFRGVLQRWIGLWGQAVLFGLAHAAGGFVPQILFAAGLGVLFGYLIRRGWSLWTLMTAHFLYDLTLLGSALVFG